MKEEQMNRMKETSKSYDTDKLEWRSETWTNKLPENKRRKKI